MRSHLDDELDQDLAEAYGANVGVRLNNGKSGYWKYCVTCLKMQGHKEETIAGIQEWVCKICNTSPAFPAQKPVFRLTKRPKS